MDNEKKQDRTYTEYDDLGNPQTKTVSMTDKEWYQRGLDEYAAQRQHELQLQQEQAYKDQMAWYDKAVNNTLAFAAMMGTDFVDYLRGHANNIAALFKGMSDFQTGWQSRSWDEIWKEAGQYEWLPSAPWTNALYEWSRKNSQLVNVTGQVTTAGSIAKLLGNTAGQVFFTVAFNAAGAQLDKALAISVALEKTKATDV